MAIGRRGFLKALGKGAAVGAAMATPAAYAGGVDLAKPGTKDVTAFNFVCGCGNNLIARVPAEESEITVACNRCPKIWRLVWKGDHFQTFSGERTGRFPDAPREPQRQAYANGDALGAPETDFPYVVEGQSTHPGKWHQDGMEKLKGKI